MHLLLAVAVGTLGELQRIVTSWSADSCCILIWATQIKLKVKFTLEQATKAQRGS